MTIATWAVITIIALAAPVYAQTADERPLQRFEMEIGAGLITGAAGGQADATLLPGDGQGTAFTLFETTSRVGAAPMFQARVGYSLSRRLTVEGGVVLSRPELRVSTSADVEDGPALTIVERIDQYFFEGSVVIMIDEGRLGPRTVPYVATGAGYVRQLHEGRTVIEHGYLFHAGGGLKHWFVMRRRGGVRAAGVRADARVYVLGDRVAVETSPRPHVAVSGSLFIAF